MEKSSKIFPREKLTFHAADKMRAETIASAVEIYFGEVSGQEFMQHFENFVYAVANAALNYTGADVLPGDLPASYIVSKPPDVFYHAKILFDMTLQCGNYGKQQLVGDLKSLLRSAERDAWQQGQSARKFLG